MQVRPMTISTNQNFNGVKIFPKAGEWEPRLLEAVLDSSSIRKTILKNEDIGSDTLIYSNLKNTPFSNEHKLELGLVKLKDGWENFVFKTTKHTKTNAIEAAIDFIKTKDAEFNIPEKLKMFNEFVSSITKNKS